MSEAFYMILFRDSNHLIVEFVGLLVGFEVVITDALFWGLEYFFFALSLQTHRAGPAY
ncbi:hypothetical protein RchiOBHm_Chr2g0104411 [Rosa chinensis]|uniref:Uncharacterized protein n=1 Tax=Rosa chinensis TaxID=74649 RepID=A0A2P6RN55_ROSCH|nr:hypothetical protein RchiOBHm_Chr2g0104411 [Rosa chinensis]